MRGVRSGGARTCKPVIPPKKSRGVKKEEERDCARGKEAGSQMSCDAWASGRDPGPAGPTHGRARVFRADSRITGPGPWAGPMQDFLWASLTGWTFVPAPTDRSPRAPAMETCG